MNNNSAPPESRAALRRLLIILAVALGFIIYSYGWTVTNIDLDTPQEASRQELVSRALKDLLSPRIFEQEREIVDLLTVDILVDCDLGDAPAAPDTTVNTYVLVTPNCGSAGDIVEVEAHGLEPFSYVQVAWVPPDDRSRPRDLLDSEREELVVNREGIFREHIEIPRIRDSEGTIHKVGLLTEVATGPPVLSKTSNNVIARMIETVFMALVATSVAIPIAAMISFFAARNLMKPIRLSIGSMLLAFIAFVIGWVIGGAVMEALISFVRNLAGDGNTLMAVIIEIVVAIAIIALTIFLSRTKLTDTENTLRKVVVMFLIILISVLTLGVVLFIIFFGKVEPKDVAQKARKVIVKLLIAIAVVFVVSAVGKIAESVGLAIVDMGNSVRPTEFLSLGDTITDVIGGAIAAIGNLFAILGTLLGLLIPVIASIIGGFILASVSIDLAASLLRQVPRQVSHLLGAILGLISGALLLGIIGMIGMTAVLLGILVPVIAAILGGQIVVIAYEQFIAGQDKTKRGYNPSPVSPLTRYILFTIGAVIVFLVSFDRLATGLALVNGELPQQFFTNILGVDVPQYILDSMLIGGVLGLVGGGLIGVQAAFPLGNTLYNVSRTSLNIIRSIEPLIMGLVFVVWVGIGPFAGVLALTLHSIAALGKLYSEQIENIDPGPIEAIQSTGASWLQTVIYSVVPQIIPPYIAFTMYRWDINVRMSTIIGFVGGGGIGLLLNQWINLLRYRDAGVAVLAIAIVVSVLDFASAYIRERIL